MEKGDGLDTLVALRNQADTATIPVIILSIVDKKNVGFALGAYGLPDHAYQQTTIIGNHA